jgi:cytochrome c553
MTKVTGAHFSTTSVVPDRCRDGAWNRAVVAMWAAALLPAAMGAAVAAAQTPADLATRSLAATCAACHGTDGHAVATSATPRLAGLDKDTFLREMREFRAGTRPFTVMQQIAKGFNDDQTGRLAEYFAGRK